MKLATVIVALLSSINDPSAPHVDIAEAKCLAKNIYYEARGESIEGQIAVANVTLNRVASADYPNTICKVVYQPAQFSWTADRKLMVKNAKAWEQAVEIAVFTMIGWVPDRTHGSTHYYNHTQVNPDWRHKFDLVGYLGAHVFYRPKG